MDDDATPRGLRWRCKLTVVKMMTSKASPRGDDDVEGPGGDVAVNDGDLRVLVVFEWRCFGKIADWERAYRLWRLCEHYSPETYPHGFLVGKDRVPFVDDLHQQFLICCGV
ncbi:hypothetical protein U1Q18_022593 [Sarracenia purpurea var. burkii]